MPQLEETPEMPPFSRGEDLFFCNYIAALNLIYRVHLKFESMNILLISVVSVSRVKSYELPEE